MKLIISVTGFSNSVHSKLKYLLEQSGEKVLYRLTKSPTTIQETDYEFTLNVVPSLDASYIGDLIEKWCLGAFLLEMNNPNARILIRVGQAKIQLDNTRALFFSRGVLQSAIRRALLGEPGLFYESSDDYFKLEEDTSISEYNPKEDPGGEIKLFFGTTRNIERGNNVNEFFGNELDSLKFGECLVNIPPGHVQGDLERPRNFWILRGAENKSNHIVLTNIFQQTEQQFLEALSNDLNHSDKSALVFVHGYNNTFAETARRAAQIKYDIPFNGIAGFFSWPSNGTIGDYLGDIERADASIPAFEEFIEKLITQTKIERLHLIAHSMGNRLMSAMLTSLLNNAALKYKLSAINQIVLAAPDIDQDVFKNNILPKIQLIGQQRTLYSSDKDSALHLSEICRGGRCRLGDAGDDLFVADGIDTIDASNVKSKGNGHAYIFDTKELLSDLFYLLGKGLKPTERRLRSRNKDSVPYWLFPE